MDTAKLSSLGWKPRVALADGIRETYEHFKSETVRQS
jgi:nucleoside-diphosphate-sugar epimerase